MTLKKVLMALIFLLSVQVDEARKPTPIPDEHSIQLRRTYDIALKSEYEFKLAQERLNSAKERYDSAVERYVSTLEAARKAAGVADNALVNVPLFTEFSVPAEQKKTGKEPDKEP